MITKIKKIKKIRYINNRKFIYYITLLFFDFLIYVKLKPIYIKRKHIPILYYTRNHFSSDIIDSFYFPSNYFQK